MFGVGLPAVEAAIHQCGQQNITEPETPKRVSCEAPSNGEHSALFHSGPKVLVSIAERLQCLPQMRSQVVLIRAWTLAGSGLSRQCASLVFCQGSRLPDSDHHDADAYRVAPEAHGKGHLLLLSLSESRLCQEYLYNGQLRGRDCTELVLPLGSKSPGGALGFWAVSRQRLLGACSHCSLQAGSRGRPCSRGQGRLPGLLSSGWIFEASKGAVGLRKKEPLSLSTIPPIARESKVARARTIGSPTPMSRPGPADGPVRPATTGDRKKRCPALSEAMEPRYGNP